MLQYRYFHIMRKANYNVRPPFPDLSNKCSPRLTQGYDLELMKNIRLIDAWPEGKVVWELDITPFYANLNGVLHWKPLASPRITLSKHRCDAWRRRRSDIWLVKRYSYDIWTLRKNRYGYNYRVVPRPKERLLGVSRQALAPSGDQADRSASWEV
jgi:hypothetical protein